MHTQNSPLSLLPVAQMLYERDAPLEEADLGEVRREAQKELTRILKRAEAQRRALGIRV